MSKEGRWSKFVRWWKNEKGAEGENSQLAPSDKDKKSESEKDAVVVDRDKERSENLEKLQAGFERLLVQLEGVNKHLDNHVTQQDELARRMENLPALMEEMPRIATSQKELTEKMCAKLEQMVVTEEQFTAAVERIPVETSKQTEMLGEIEELLGGSAQTQSEMKDGFKNFNYAMDRLNSNTASHRDSILQMSRTFQASDRYLKYLMGVQNRRFMWLFVVMIGVLFTTILILTGVIIYMKM